MNLVLTLVIYMGIVTWLTLVAANLIRIKVWTFQGILLGFGNRDDLPGPSAFAGRAERTARNTLENFVLFVAVALVAQAAGAQSPRLAAGAQVFFWARLLYIPVYYAGIKYLRTAVWVVSIVGLAMMLSVLL